MLVDVEPEVERVLVPLPLEKDLQNKAWINKGQYKEAGLTVDCAELRRDE